MTGFLDDSEAEIDCPVCGQKIKERLGVLKNNPTIKCPGCGVSIAIEAGGHDGLAEGMDSIDRSVEELKQALSKLEKPSE
jgi:ribosomal protein S27E